MYPRKNMLFQEKEKNFKLKELYTGDEYFIIFPLTTKKKSKYKPLIKYWKNITLLRVTSILYV